MRIYRLVILILLPVLVVWLLLRLIFVMETRQGLRQRLALGSGPAPKQPSLWLHGASLGELVSARPLLLHLLEKNENLQIVVTANTYTGRDMVAEWRNPRLHGRLAPLDNASSVERFLSAWQPRIAITLENEIWPTRMAACFKRDIPIVVLGARISENTAAKWRWFPGLAREVTGYIAALAPLDAQSAGRFADLGVDPDRIGLPVNLKASVRLEPPAAAELAKMAGIFPHQSTILAASTHQGEDQIILNGFVQALSDQPDLRLIIAPRHPKRADQIAAMLKQAGLGFTRRSEDAHIKVNDQVYIADTIGEMSLWYSVCAATFVGGSLVDKGGHTPVEPTQFGSAVIHGPYVSNHSTGYELLAAKNAAVFCQDASDITQAILSLSNPKTASQMARLARAALSKQSPKTPQPKTLLKRLDDLSSGKLIAALLD